jgi:hypothetical protein
MLANNRLCNPPGFSVGLRSLFLQILFVNFVLFVVDTPCLTTKGTKNSEIRELATLPIQSREHLDKRSQFAIITDQYAEAY